LEFLPNSKEFKILLLSNAPFTPSGYGVQTQGMCYDWNKHYHVRVLVNYGLQGRMLALNNLAIYPNLSGDPHGDKTARLIFRNWKPDLFLTLYDIWMGAYVEGAGFGQFKAIHPHHIPIVMVDHNPIPEATLEVSKVAYRRVVPTRYAQKQFLLKGLTSDYIPFGIDTKIFKPSKNQKEDKLYLNKMSMPFNLREKTEIDENSFLVVINGANKDPYRKGFMRAFIAIQIFLEQNPDAKKDFRYYIHSWMKMSRDIPHGAKTMQVHPYGRGCNDYHMLCGVPDKGMARIYGASDVFIHPSQGGGFEIPLLEAMSCGVPVIASDFICMRELAKDHGWLIPYIEGESGAKSLYFSPLDATQIIVDEFKLADALEDAYNHPKKRKAYGRRGREFALKFDWKLVNEMWYSFFEGIREEWKYKTLKERRI